MRPKITGGAAEIRNGKQASQHLLEDFINMTVSPS